MVFNHAEGKVRKVRYYLEVNYNPFEKGKEWVSFSRKKRYRSFNDAYIALISAVNNIGDDAIHYRFRIKKVIEISEVYYYNA